MKTWSFLAVVVLSGATCRAQQAADAAAGERLFAANCAVCHGADGTGGASRINLTRGGFKHGGGDQELFNTISKGIPGTEMPGSFLSPGEIRQVVEFVQSLANLAGESGGAGDAARGEKLFHGRGGCLPCHRVTEQGSHAEAQLGPNLHGIGERRADSELREAIPRVHRGLAEFHWQVIAVTASGQRITGMRLNEDTHSIQLRENSGNQLVALLKKDLKELKVERGKPLPAFQEGLSAGEIDDLAAYLSSLRRGEPGQ